MSRDAVLSNIRRSLGVSGQELTRLHIVEERLEQAPKGVVPARGQGDRAERVATFRRMAEISQASVAEVAAAGDVPAVVAAYLRDNDLPAAIRRGGDERLAAMPWSDTALDVAVGASTGSDLAAISHALAGVAETGTLVLVSGPGNPTTLNFLPDHHLVVVDARDIAADYEGAWKRVRGAYGKGEMPRTVNWITGPSRSADIEQTLLIGAHGPRRVHVIVVNG